MDVGARVGEERGEFVGVPGHAPSAVIAPEPGSGGEPDRVGGQHPASDGVIADVSQQQMDLVDRLRGETPGPVVTSTIEESLVEAFGILRVQITQHDGAERREDVQAQVAAVAVDRGRPQLTLFGR